MKRYLIVLIALLLPIAAGAWTLPVPSGLTAGNEIYASDGHTLGARGVVTVAPDNNAVMRSTMSGVSVLINSSAGSADTLKLTETGALAGQKVTVCNESSTSFTIPDESGVFVGGGSTVSQYDCIDIVYTGAIWYQTGAVSAN